MFIRQAPDPARLADLERIEAMVRRHFALGPDDLVLPAEEQTRTPGLPPRATLVRFWKGAARHRLRLFRPPSEVTEADLPAAWLLPSLIDDGDPDCC